MWIDRALVPVLNVTCLFYVPMEGPAEDQSEASVGPSRLLQPDVGWHLPTCFLVRLSVLEYEFPVVAGREANGCLLLVRKYAGTDIDFPFEALVCSYQGF
jgi:hypothetical protein